MYRVALRWALPSLLLVVAVVPVPVAVVVVVPLPPFFVHVCCSCSCSCCCCWCRCWYCRCRCCCCWWCRYPCLCRCCCWKWWRCSWMLLLVPMLLEGCARINAGIDCPAARMRGPSGGASDRAVPGIEPGTSRTRNENHATRPNSQLARVRARAVHEYPAHAVAVIC